MRKLILALISIFVAELLFHSCANPTPPTGGAKDSIPPKLISSYPQDQALNFHDQTITLTFDETINTDKIKQNLIITPITDVNYKVLPKKQTVTLRFEEPFEDSTTYTLNFFAGITDITEKNPAENLVIAFSTTNYIDSLEIIGKVSDLYTGTPKEKMTVGLYRITDSLDLTSFKPTYFITTNETGGYRIQNIKQNKYLLLAFKDENQNLLFDASSEQYAFYSDTINLTESITDSLQIFSLSVDASPLKLISSRPAGRYFEARYSKPLTDYHVNFPDASKGPASDFSGESESIRFYNNLNLQETDSVKAYLTVYDSLKNTITDTLYVKFRSSARKPANYSTSLTPSSGTWTEDTRITINFSKPTRIINDSSFLYIPIDTLYEIPLNPINPAFNFNHTNYSFSLPQSIKQLFTDTLESKKRQVQQTDTLNIDTARLIIQKQLERIQTNTFTLNIRPATFVSVEEDTSKAMSGNYKFSNPEDYGTIKVTVDTQKPSYIVQLMSKDKIVKQIRNCTSCTFNQVLPGNYWVRVLIDENNNGKWSPGNFQKFEAPEPVVHFKTESALRANWQIELTYSF